MKRQINAIWLSLLILVSLLLLAAIVVLYDVSPVMMYDGNTAVTSTMTDAQLGYITVGVKALLRFVLAPAIVLTGVWVLAFFCERKELNDLRKQMSQHQRGA